MDARPHTAFTSERREGNKARDSSEHDQYMKMSSNGNIFCVNVPFVRRIPRSPVNSPDKGPWRGAQMFLCSAPEQTTEQTIVSLGIWDAIALIMTSP